MPWSIERLQKAGVKSECVGSCSKTFWGREEARGFIKVLHHQTFSGEIAGCRTDSWPAAVRQWWWCRRCHRPARAGAGAEWWVWRWWETPSVRTGVSPCQAAGAGASGWLSPQSTSARTVPLCWRAFRRGTRSSRWRGSSSSSWTSSRWSSSYKELGPSSLSQWRGNSSDQDNKYETAHWGKNYLGHLDVSFLGKYLNLIQMLSLPH